MFINVYQVYKNYIVFCGAFPWPKLHSKTSNSHCESIKNEHFQFGLIQGTVMRPKSSSRCRCSESSTWRAWEMPCCTWQMIGGPLWMERINQICADFFRNKWSIQVHILNFWGVGSSRTSTRVDKSCPWPLGKRSWTNKMERCRASSSKYPCIWTKHIWQPKKIEGISATPKKKISVWDSSPSVTS